MRWTAISRQGELARQERRVAQLNATVVVSFAAAVVASDKVSALSLVKLAAGYIAITLLIAAFAVTLYAGQVLVRSGAASGWSESPMRAIASALTRRWRDERMFGLLWPITLFLLLMPTFNAFKQRLLPSAGFVHDRTLAELDRLLFGTDPGLLLHQLIGSPAATRFFDAIYHSWFVPTTLGLCVVGLCASPRTRAQYVTAYVGVWILLGGVLAYLFPAAGPAFYADLVGTAGAEPFVAVSERLSSTSGSAGFLTSLYNQDYLIRNLDNPVLVVGGGISAIPSVHNAMAVLFAIAAFRANALLGMAMSLFALTIWIASVYLNWHYAVDGIAGGLGAAVLWYASGRLVDRLFDRPADTIKEIEQIFPEPSQNGCVQVN